MVPIEQNADTCQRIALINPTKFLGNLLIAGGLIQALAADCRRRDVQLLLVLDQRYRPLLERAFDAVEFVWYPRSELLRPGQPNAWKAWWRCVRRIRAFRADLAFPIEDDSVAHQLTRLSGARRRVASSAERHPFGFHEVLPVPRSGRRPPESHIWFSYRDVLERLDLAGALPVAPCYIRLPDFESAGVNGPESSTIPYPDVDRGSGIVLHAGATKNYKKWPLAYFAELAKMLLERGDRVFLIGAGRSDAEVNRAIIEQVGEAARGVVDLCDRLSLPQLTGLLRNVDAVVGNDSGPMHLAGAVGTPGVVIFGPTDTALWHPLVESVQMVENRGACDPRCRRRVCHRQYACLQGITPADVLDRLPVRPI
ncbi:MAG: glycosyltransferase family 9 protein [Pseudohongiellaceae bacterium]